MKNQIALEVRGRDGLHAMATRAGIPEIVTALLEEAGIKEGKFTLIIGQKGAVGGCDRPAARVMGVASGSGVHINVCAKRQEDRFKCFLSSPVWNVQDLCNLLRRLCINNGWFYYTEDKPRETKPAVPEPSQPETTPPAPENVIAEAPPQEEVLPETPAPEVRARGVKGIFDDETFFHYLLEAIILKAQKGIITSVDVIDILKKDMVLNNVTTGGPQLLFLTNHSYLLALEKPPVGVSRRYRVLRRTYETVKHPLPEDYVDVEPATPPKAESAKAAPPAEKTSLEVVVPQQAPPSHVNGTGLKPFDIMMGKVKSLCEKAERYDAAKRAREERFDERRRLEQEIEELEGRLTQANVRLKFVIEAAAIDDKIIADSEYHGARQRYEKLLQDLEKY